MERRLIVSKYITALLLVGGASLPLVGEEEKKFSAQIGITDSWLLEQTVISGVDTGDYIDEFSIGLNMRFDYHINDNWAVGVGHNAITFEESGGLLGETTSDLEARATYLSVEYSSNPSMFQGYGSFELGVSEFEDVDLTSPDYGLYDYNMYESDSDTYYSIGGGVKYNINNDIYLDLGYRFRDYGSLKRNKVNFTPALKDLDVRTSSIDLSFGVRF